MQLLKTLRKKHAQLITREKNIMSYIHNAELSLVLLLIVISGIGLAVGFMMPGGGSKNERIDGGGSKNEFIRDYDGGGSKNEFIRDYDGGGSKNE